MIRVCMTGDLHLGAGTSHGAFRTDDYLAAFDRVREKARECDCLLLAGDCYDSANPSPTLQVEFSRRVRETAEHVPVIVLVGNHDHGVREGTAHPADIFQALACPGVTVIRTAGVHEIQTRSGPLLVVGLPFVPKARLLAKLEQAPSAAEATALMVDLLALTLGRLAEQVTAQRAWKGEQVPCILAGHWLVAGASPGGWMPRAAGPQEVVVPLAAVQNPVFDACLFGHIHRPQQLGAPQPPMLYCGSPERVTFGEEDEPRTFPVVSVSRGHATYETFPTGARKFLTLDLGECVHDDVFEELDYAIAAEGVDHRVEGAVVRLTYSLSSGAPTPSEREIRRRLTEAGAAHVASVKRVIPAQEFRARSSAVAVAAGPLDMLSAYFDTVQEPAERKARLLELARQRLEQRNATEVAA